LACMSDSGPSHKIAIGRHQNDAGQLEIAQSSQGCIWDDKMLLLWEEGVLLPKTVPLAPVRGIKLRWVWP
jgi:hypothetical protein